MVSKACATLEFVILGLRKDDIEAVKREIDKCCSEESADNLIAGPEYSDVIKVLTQQQVHYTCNFPVHVTSDHYHKLMSRASILTYFIFRNEQTKVHMPRCGYFSRTLLF